MNTPNLKQLAQQRVAAPLTTMLLLTIVACGGGQTTDVRVELNEWSIAPSVGQVKAGNVKFVATNNGTEPHEFVIIKTDLAPGSLPVVEGKVDEDRVDIIDEIEPFAAKVSETKTLKLSAGKYVLICNIVERVPGSPVKSHYENGMRTSFTVTE